MKKIIYILLLIGTFATVLYFNQDRMALYVLKTDDKKIDTTFLFSTDNHLCSIEIPSKKIDFELDDEGRKISKSVNGAVVERYFWLGEEKLHLVTDAYNNILREYLYKTVYDLLPYGMKTQENNYKFIFNKMKTLRVVLDSQEKVIKIIDYDEKGLRVKETNPSLKVDFSYAGGIMESETKLLFFLQGVYDPKTGQWISRIKNDDIIQNLKNLTQLKSDEVYRCSDTLDVYYHSYICTNGECGGLYATDYLEYFNGKGYIVDNSAYFNKKRCDQISLPNTTYDKQLFASCVYNKIQPRHVKLFDVFKHNCHDEVNDIIQYCTTKSRLKVIHDI